MTLQETHFRKKGKLNDKLRDFEIFEAIRNKGKGGTLIAAHKSLKPVLIEEYSEEFELLVIEVKLGNKDIRVMSGYGPQENLSKEERLSFFAKLEEEVVKAKMNNKEVFIEMDANSKLGENIINGDPHKQSDNGKMLAEILQRNALVVINGLETKCHGRITRRRITPNVKEESIIDFVITSEEVADLIEKMVVDEDKKYGLARFTKSKGKTVIKESDHNSIITYVKAEWNKDIVTKRKESYNFKDEESLKKFKVITSKNTFLSEVFTDENKNVEVTSKQFIKRLKFCISKSFKKIRLKGPRKDEETEKLFNERRELKSKEKTEANMEALNKVEELLAVQFAEQNHKIVKEACEGLSNETGGVNVQGMWKMKKKLKGTHGEPPAAMLDKHGNVVTDIQGIENIVLDRYEERLKTLPIKQGLHEHKVKREELCDRRLQEAQKNATPDWSMNQLETVLKQLKNSKSKDPLDLPNELFKPPNIGSDLKLALLRLMNHIKRQQKVPKVLKYCNITSIYKNKGTKKDFENYRGVFRVVTLRNILDKLIYNDEYPGIDEHLTDSNVGARKERNSRDNIFVLNAVLNEVSRKRAKGVDIQIFDVYKCFDKLWAKECFNDLFESGFANDKLPLLFDENMDAQVAVKTASGTTRRTTVNEVVMQGTVWGSLMCTNTMDNLGKLSYDKPEMLYQYKGVPIPPLGMVDDILSVSTVENTSKVNSLINTFIESKKLQLSEKKCSRIHIGRGHEDCPELKVHENVMNESESDKYLGDIVDKSGKIQATVANRIKRGQGSINEIMAILSEIPFGKFRTEVALQLRESMLLSGMLFNSEAWHGTTSANIASLEKVDQQLLRSILNCHRNTTKEFLYLETGTIPIGWIISQRRINYLFHILTRDDRELIKKVFMAQKENPMQGDFVKIVQEDLRKFGMTYDEVACGTWSKKGLKGELSKRARQLVLGELLTSMQRSTKVRSMKYNKLELQPYLQSNLTYDEKSMLTAIRSKCVRDIKGNFPNMHKVCQHCPMNCNIEEPQLDTQEHVLTCAKLGGSNIDIEFMHASVVEQSQLVRDFLKLMRVRSTVLEAANNVTGACCLPGATILDQSDPRGATSV